MKRRTLLSAGLGAFCIAIPSIIAFILGMEESKSEENKSIKKLNLTQAQWKKKINSCPIPYPKGRRNRETFF